jgi:hypothetical protein
MQQVFKNTILLQEPVVLGVQLMPLTLWHVFALQVAESPYVQQGEVEKSLFDLCFAVGICSRTWEEGQAWIKNPDHKEIAALGKKWGKSWNTWEVGVKESEKFEAYLCEYAQMPKRWTESKAAAMSEGIKNPWPIVLVQKLSPGCGELRAWDMPLPQAVAYWSAAMELEGDASLLSERDERAIGIKHKIQAEMKATRKTAQEVIAAWEQ